MRRALLLIPAAGLIFGAIAGCSSEDTQTRCSTNGCTITFNRGVNAQASVLGVKGELVRVQNHQATLRFARQKLVVSVGGERET